MAEREQTAAELLGSATLDRLSKVGNSSQIVTIQVPANGIAPGKATGRFLYVIDAVAPIQVKLESNAFIDAEVGTELQSGPGAFFEGFEIRNLADFAITVRIYVGFARYITHSFSAIEPLTESFGAFASTINNGAQEVIAPRTGPNIIRRKHCLVTNLHATEILTVNGANDQPIATVFPLSVGVIATADQITIVNGTASVIGVQVGEIYWVLYPSQFGGS